MVSRGVAGSTVSRCRRGSRRLIWAVRKLCGARCQDLLRNSRQEDMGSTSDVREPRLPGDAGRPMSTAEHAVFVELLTRVGCHVYTGEVLPDGSYREIYTGPGIELFLGGDAD